MKNGELKMEKGCGAAWTRVENGSLDLAGTFSIFNSPFSIPS
jgi:hypothetical protein